MVRSLSGNLKGMIGFMKTKAMREVKDRKEKWGTFHLATVRALGR